MSKLGTIVSIALLVTAINPVAAQPQPQPYPQSHPDPRPEPVHNGHPHQSYTRLDLPSTAAMLLISGITYAVVDGLYYERQGNNYIYVNNPPVAEPNTTTTIGVGRIVHSVPTSAKHVTVDGVGYYVDGGTWYAPIAGSQNYVIVEPQL